MDRPPDVTRAQAHALLRERFAGDAGGLEALPGGEFSQAFAFVAGGRPYVLRLNAAVHAAEGFANDDYAARHFASPTLPIPRVVATGALANGHFAISERAAGRRLTEYDPAERRALLPALLDTLDAIGRADVQSSRGYGPWGSDGNGQFARWRDYLAAINENEDGGYNRDWHALFRDSFLERELYDTVYRRMLRLAAHCPEERGLIHNDYWFMNILGEIGPACARISGVIDWADALYGDPLYEIARLAWGADYPGWWYADGAALLQARYGTAPGYTDRIACYECHLALGDLRFYAKTGRREEYDWARGRLMARMSEDAD